MNILSHKGKEYLILVDYFSDVFEREPLINQQSARVIKLCKKTFTRYGIPNHIHSENGSQFTLSEFSKFSQEWGFTHMTSSPGHQQCNGKAETAAKIMKRIMRRAEDPYLALLEYRNTPTVGMTTSPAQKMLGDATRSTLPSGNCSRKVDVLDQELKQKEATQHSYNKTARFTTSEHWMSSSP